MKNEVYRYHFESSIDIAEVEATLVLAMIAAEGLHGAAKVRLEASHRFDAQQRTCVIESTAPVGMDINRIFVGFLRREFGEESFKVGPISGSNPDPVQSTATAAA
jgi:hypothetical protein